MRLSSLNSLSVRLIVPPVVGFGSAPTGAKSARVPLISSVSGAGSDEARLPSRRDSLVELLALLDEPVGRVMESSGSGEGAEPSNGWLVPRTVRFHAAPGAPLRNGDEPTPRPGGRP